MRSTTRLAGNFVLGLVAALGCSGGDGGSGPDQSIQVSASPPALTVQQGSSGTVNLTLTRGGGFAGNVTVTVEGLPTGVTVSVSPSPLTGSTTSATVTVTVAASVPAGTYTATVRASASGVGAATATYQLTVTAIPNYALSATPNATTVGQGGSGVVGVNITRTNFTGPVTLTLDNPPAGITGSFNPSPASGDLSQLTINVAAAAATGSHTLTVKGSAAGPGDKTTTITLTVTPPPNFTLSVNPNALVINAGSNQQATVNITRTIYAGPVTLSLDNPQAGVTATFDPPAPTGNTSTMTLNVAGTVASGNYNISVKGNAPGVPIAEEGAASASAAMLADRFFTVMLTVMPAPDYSLSVNPSAVTTSPGGTANTSGTVNRTNFTASVAFDLPNPPAGISGTFNPTSTTGTSFALTLNVPGSTAPGSYTVTIRGTSGTLVKTTQVQVTVAAGTQVVYAFGDPTMVPTWFGVKDGNGPWARIQPTTAGGVTSFTFNMTAATGAVSFTMGAGAGLRDANARLARAMRVSPEVMAAATQPGARTPGATSRRVASAVDDGVYVGGEYLGTVAEHVAWGRGWFQTPPARGLLEGTVADMPPADDGFLGCGDAQLLLGPATATYGMDATAGVINCVRLRSPVGQNDYFFGRFYRNVSVPGTLAMDLWSSDPSVIRTSFTIPGGLAGSLYTASQGVETAAGLTGTIPLGQLNSVPSRTGVTLSGTLATDNYFLNVQAFRSTSNIQDIQYRTQYLGSSFAPSGFTLPAAVTTFTVTEAVGAPGENLFGTTVPAPTGSENFITTIYTGDVGVNAAGNSYLILATKAWMTANGNMITMESKANAGFPQSAYLALPRQSSTVSRSASNITGSTKPPGSFVTQATRVQIP